MAPPGSVIVEDVWESFRLYHDRPLGLKDRIAGRRRTTVEEFWALQGVSLEVSPGQTVALIGANGSGKSTLLKILARILTPTRGRIEIKGRTAALLELGAGFHGDLTGRENVYLNASILGFSKRDVDRIFDDIVDFAELHRHIDTPVRNYSSGQYVRLGFGVAVHLEPEIFLVDEVLSVGDARFQARCFDRVRRMQREGTTIIVVTHDLDLASTMCERAILLDGGQVADAGVSHEVVTHYRERVAEGQREEPGRFEGGEVHGSGDMAVGNIELHGGEGPDGTLIYAGEPFAVSYRATACRPVQNPVFGLIVRSADGTYLFDTNTLWRHQKTGSFEPGEQVEVRFDLRANLLSGVYMVSVAAASEDGRQPFDWHTDALGFEVQGPTDTRGFAHLEGTITMERAEVAS